MRFVNRERVKNQQGQTITTTNNYKQLQATTQTTTWTRLKSKATTKIKH